MQRKRISHYVVALFRIRGLQVFFHSAGPLSHSLNPLSHSFAIIPITLLEPLFRAHLLYRQKTDQHQPQQKKPRI